MENTLLTIQFILSSVLAGVNIYGWWVVNKVPNKDYLYRLGYSGLFGLGAGLAYVLAHDALHGVLL